MTHGPAAKAPLPPPPPPQQQQHRDQQQQQSPLATVEVPKAEFKPQPPTSETSISAAVCPVAVSVSAAATSAGNSAAATATSSSSSNSRGKVATKCSINCAYIHNNNCSCHGNKSQCHSSSHSSSNSNNNTNLQVPQKRGNNTTPMPPLANANKAPLIVLKTAAAAAATGGGTTAVAAAASASSSPIKRRKNPPAISPLSFGLEAATATATGGGSCCSSSASTSPQTSPAVRQTKASRLRAAALDKKKEEEQQQQRQRYSSPCSPRNTGTGAAAATTGGRSPSRRLSSSEISPKSAVICGFNSEPATAAGQQFKPRSTSQPADTPPTQRRHNLVAVGSGLSMKQNLSELHFTASSDCTLKMMRPRSSTLSTEQTDAQNGARDNLNLANLQLSPVQKHKRTPESSPRRLGDRDKSAKRKSNLNRSLTEEATKDGDEADATNRRRRRRELGMARPLVPGDDEALRDLLSQSPLKSSCSESTGASKSEPVRSVVCTYPGLRHPEVAVRTMTAVLPTPRPLHATQPAAKSLAQKFNERTRADLAEIKKIVDQTEEKQQQQQQPEELSSQKMSAAALRRKSTDEAGATGAAQSSPPAPNQIVSILKKKEQAFGDCNSSASSNASPVTFSSSVMDPPLAGTARSKRQGILKKRSSLDESRYYSRSHSPDERSILIKSARRNSLEEAGTGLSPAQSHGILKQSSYDSSKSATTPSFVSSIINDKND